MMYPNLGKKLSNGRNRMLCRQSPASQRKYECEFALKPMASHMQDLAVDVMCCVP